MMVRGRSVCFLFVVLAGISMTARPAPGFLNNGFETDWVYALKTSDSSLVALRESDGAVMRTLLPPVDLSNPANPAWETLTFAGTPANNDARLFVAQVFPRQVGDINQHPKNFRISELDPNGNTVRTVQFNTLLPGTPAEIGPFVRLGTLRYSSFHGSLFVSMKKHYRDDTVPVTIYEVDLNLTQIKNTYIGPNVHNDEPCMDINPIDGTLYISEPNLGQPPSTTLPRNGQGDLVAIDTSAGSTNSFRTLVDGTTRIAVEPRWYYPRCPIYRGTHNPSGRPTVLMLFQGNAVGATPTLEYFLDASDGTYPPHGNLAQRGSPYTGFRNPWRGQLDELTRTVIATRLFDRFDGSAGIDLLGPDDTIRRISGTIGYQDADSPGAALQSPPVTPAGMPQIDPQDPRRFVMDDQPWYPAGYYPGLGTMTIRGDQTTLQDYMNAFIDKLSASGLNYCRLVFSMHQGYGGLPTQESLPYVTVGSTTGDGFTFPVVDLNQFNQAHFDYVRSVLERARDKGVVVQLCIFESWHINNVELPWHRKYDFYSPGMNSNGVAVTSGDAWHSTDPQSVAWQRHTALARKMVDTFGDLPNIVWEISNEPNKYYDGNSYPGRPAPVNDWTMQMGNYLKNYELTSRGLNHVCMPVDLPDHQHTAGQRPDFFGTATNENDGHTPSGTRRDLLFQIANSTAMPAPQPLIADNDAGGSALSPADRRRKAWACLTTGSHIDYFHYELNNLTTLNSQDVSDGMRWIGYTPKFLTDLSLDLRGMVPSDSLVTSGWCYARAGSEYIVYLGTGGTTTLSQMPDFCEANWFNPRNGASQPAIGGPSFTAPDSNDWVLHVRCVGRAPFNGEPAMLPGRIEAEDYDIGGEGVAYHDTTPGNDGAVYREDNVDIEATADVDGGYNVGWIAAGEWLEYLVNVTTHGRYDISLRVAAHPAANSSIDFHLAVDGTDVTGPQTTSPTTGWQDFKTVTVSRVELEPGIHVLRLAMDSSNWNVNWLEAALVARIVAVDFDRDGDVDLEDFGFFQLCLSGSGIPHAPGCEAADLNQDTAVDQLDVSVFLGCLAGANLPPGC